MSRREALTSVLLVGSRIDIKIWSVTPSIQLEHVRKEDCKHGCLEQAQKCMVEVMSTSVDELMEQETQHRGANAEQASTPKGNCVRYQRVRSSRVIRGLISDVWINRRINNEYNDEDARGDEPVEDVGAVSPFACLQIVLELLHLAFKFTSE